MRTPRVRPPALPLASALAGAALVLAVAQPVSAATDARPSYVALGDSFAAGVGARTYDPASAGCYRSPKSYPALVAARSGLRLTFAACAGARTADVLHQQVPSLRRATGYVSLTIGGNDLGFARVLTTCARPGWLGSCRKAVERARRTLRRTLPGRLDTVLATIRSRSPQARVVVTGYPRLFGGADCSALTFFSGSERRRLNAATDELDALIRARTRAAGMRYVSPAASFRGHAWCDHDAWVNGVSNPLVNSYHPNLRGHAAYAGVVGPALAGRRYAAAGAGAPTAAGVNVRQPDGVTPRDGYVVRVPDLRSAAVTRASIKAGVTPAELARLRRAQQSGAPNSTLDRLDAEISRRAAARRAAAASTVRREARAPRTSGRPS
jgi:lysophospholipase L1-like esterase